MISAGWIEEKINVLNSVKYIGAATGEQIKSDILSLISNVTICSVRTGES